VEDHFGLSHLQNLHPSGAPLQDGNREVARAMKQYKVRLSNQLHSALKKSACLNERSLNAEICIRLEMALLGIEPALDRVMKKAADKELKIIVVDEDKMRRVVL
jgi:hypothetical protein